MGVGGKEQDHSGLEPGVPLGGVVRLLELSMHMAWNALFTRSDRPHRERDRDIDK